MRVIGSVGMSIPVSREGPRRASHVTYGIRPEDMDLSTDGTGLELVVDVVEELGADAYIYGTAAGVNQIDTDGAAAPSPSSPGSTVGVLRSAARRCTSSRSRTTRTSSTPTAGSASASEPDPAYRLTRGRGHRHGDHALPC